MEKITKLFKSRLSEKIQNNFNDCWDQTDVDQQLVELEKSKEIAAGAEKKWRPTNLDVEAQLRPRIARVLISKKKFLTMQVEYQTELITGLLGCLDAHRDGLQACSEKRGQLLAAINKDLEKGEVVEQQITEMHASKFHKK